MTVTLKISMRKKPFRKSDEWYQHYLLRMKKFKTTEDAKNWLKRKYQKAKRQPIKFVDIGRTPFKTTIQGYAYTFTKITKSGAKLTFCHWVYSKAIVGRS